MRRGCSAWSRWALATQPEVLLCDEITSALDPLVGATIVDLLVHLRETTGIALVVVTHDLSVVRRLGGPVAMLARGELLPISSTMEIR